jgi:hypothetical protein
MIDDSIEGGSAAMDDLVVRPLAHVRIRNLSGTIIIAVGDDAAELSDIAESIWRAMAPDRTVGDIVRTIAAAYDEPEAVVRDDVHEFLADLIGDTGLIYIARNGEFDIVIDEDVSAWAQLPPVLGTPQTRKALVDLSGLDDDVVHRLLGDGLSAGFVFAGHPGDDG